MGLADRYGDDLQFNQHCKMLITLAFVPPEMVVTAWKALQDLPDWSFDEDHGLIVYFLETYIGPFGRGENLSAHCFR